MNTRVGFSKPKKFNPISWLIRKLTGSVASHAFFVYSDADWGADFVMEASSAGFRLVPLARFEKQNDVVATFRPRASIERGLTYVAREYLGVAYDYGGLLGSSVVVFGSWLKRKWRNPLQDAKALFCSEAVVVALQRSDYPGSERLVASSTTPQDLLRFFVAEVARAG